ncbi:unnamed protein product, partial [Mesorhabditis belari]|uniref:DEAD/DEAH box helicase n=1 Tax=Mesorhabditis belari TaxID=2138241 RepID=A0AAF3EB42_9BILA
MSGNWDDTDSEDDMVVVVEEKPVIMPRSRQPSMAKSLEKASILENPVAGSTKDDSDDDGASTTSRSAGSESFEDDSDVIFLDYDSDRDMKKMISLFRCGYRDIIAEFADVEIFLISLDSLIIECTAHCYHNWTLAGQSLVLNSQIDRFLEQFTQLGGKFKLVIFSELSHLFTRDTTLGFIRATALAHLRQGPHKNDIEVFSSPLDPRWGEYLQEITPSFLMISTENVSSKVCGQEEVNFTPQLETIVLDALTRAIAVVPLFRIVVNFSKVNAYYIEPKLVVAQNQEQFFAAYWDSGCQGTKKTDPLDISKCPSIADIWALIIKEALTSDAQRSEHFEALCCATLVSALICEKKGARRVYQPERKDGKRGLDVIRDRRHLLQVATAFIEGANWGNVKIAVNDFWDGRMVLSLFDAITAGETVLPYRVQESFARVHTTASLQKPIPTDTTDKLFDVAPELENPFANLPWMYKVNSQLLQEYVPEWKELDSNNQMKHSIDIAKHLKSTLNWKFKPIEEDFAKNPEKIEDTWQQKRANKGRQFLSRWYEMFANSLEGRGSNLLVDFSRAPKGFATNEETNGRDTPKENKGWAGQKAGGGKKSKEAVKSKKDLILEANKNVKANKLMDGEKNKIKFATQQRNAISYLENLSLDLPETKALCNYEIIVRVGREMQARYAGEDHKRVRQREAVHLVGLLKESFISHWQHLDEKQRDDIVNIWVSLGFEAPEGRKASSDAKSKKLDLGLNMIYYQLQYAGELIDIQSDPQKDDRVSGFSPDAWQRKMLDIVDRGQSAVIIAPTSAGKTFVSYYCIEKILRASDEDVVVYLSPSKALTNQVCGSVYARFRNKLLTRGKALFGTLTTEYGTNALNCQVLVTVPDCLETILLSTNPVVQQFVSKIKYVIFDEVHSIGASEEAAIWEHLLLLIRCPFLALSATIGNANNLYDWLNTAETAKKENRGKVNLIQYHERYSELELAIQNIDPPEPIVETNEDEEEKPLRIVRPKDGESVLTPLMPYGVFMPEKIRMFGIPDDHQLTARQVFDLYQIVAEFDTQTKEELEPCKFFGYAPGKPAWISRTNLRKLETELKKRFIHWLNHDEKKLSAVLNKLSNPVAKQLDNRSKPFNQKKVSQENIVGLIEELQEESMLPAICFNDDRFVCESLATILCDVLEKKQTAFEESAEFKEKYEIKNEEKLLKMAKRKRDAADKKKKGDKPEDEPQEEDEDFDPFAAQRQKLKEALAKFRLHGRTAQNDDVYDKMVERMARQAKGRESTRLLLRLFERGIGFHHAGLSMVEKGAVEVLFRSGHLAIIFSTSTLALGMNMPCKTVIFGVDTPFLTPLLYRQMSGRAGRRGYDHAGTVIFMALPTSKIRRLLTASLSTLHGNPPFTISYLLRLLAFVHQEDVPNSLEKNAPPISTLAHRTKIVLTLIQNSFSLFTRKEADNGTLQKQLRIYTIFSVQMLRHLQLIDEQCNVSGLSQLACLLQGAEPGNLLFIYLLQNDVFHSICKKYTGEKLKRKILVIMANLFTRIYLPPSFDPEDKSTYPSDTQCQIFLDSLPESVQSKVEKFNETAMKLFTHLMSAVNPEKSLWEDSFLVTGSEPTETTLFNEDLVTPHFAGISHDDSFLPTLNLAPKDHRGRRFYLNAYAIDFWHNESRRLLEAANKLATNQMWYLLHDFKSILEKISVGLESVARPQDPFAEVMKEIAREYDSKFRSAFGMKHKSGL